MIATASPDAGSGTVAKDPVPVNTTVSIPACNDPPTDGNNVAVRIGLFSTKMPPPETGMLSELSVTCNVAEEKVVVSTN